mmetsp:Transcript_11941/g.15401  ORF Transcript_11941/g.15401 Transcript_11941/m.15401 type:complete len:336 (+) Transcript_11941:105-1112(+)
MSKSASNVHNSLADSSFSYSEYSKTASKQATLLDRNEIRRLELEQSLFEKAMRQMVSLDAAPATKNYIEKSENKTVAIIRSTEDQIEGASPGWILHGPEHRRNLLHTSAMYGRDEALVEIIDSVEIGEVDYAAAYKSAKGIRNKKAIPKAIPIGICLNTPDARGDTALILAARGGHFECARILLSKGAQMDHQNASLHTAMHCAAINDEKEMLELLFLHDANPTLTTFTKYKPSHLARKQGHLRTAIWLEWAEEDYLRRHPIRKRKPRGLFIECKCSYCAPLKAKGGNRDDPTLAIVGAHRKVEPPGYTVQHDAKVHDLIMQARRRSKMAKKKDE